MSLRSSFLSGIYSKQVNKNSTLQNKFCLPFGLIIFFFTFLSMFPSSFQSSPSFLSFPYSLQEPRQGRSASPQQQPSLPSMPESEASVGSLKKYTASLYVLIDQVAEGNYSFEHSRLLELIDRVNFMLRHASFKTFYLQLSLVELKVQEEAYVPEDDLTLQESMAKWHENSFSTTAHLKYVFSKRKYSRKIIGNGKAPYGVLGITNMDSICRQNGSGILIGYMESEKKDKFLATLMHEILHAFNYFHDDKVPECRGHLLSADFLSVNKWSYSSCSIKHMEDWIKSSKNCQLGS